MSTKRVENDLKEKKKNKQIKKRKRKGKKQRQLVQKLYANEETREQNRWKTKLDPIAANARLPNPPRREFRGGWDHHENKMIIIPIKWPRVANSIKRAETTDQNDRKREKKKHHKTYYYLLLLHFSFSVSNDLPLGGGGHATIGVHKIKRNT